MGVSSGKIEDLVTNSYPKTHVYKPCILRFDRVFDGSIQSTTKSEYSCKRGVNKIFTDKTSLLTTILAWKITVSTNCDESKQTFSATGLKGEGSTIVRHDGFAHFFGTCSVIEKKFGQPEITHFKGSIELIGRTGSHQSLGELCNQDEHIEGWLVGQGQGELSNCMLNAIIVCKGKFPSGALPDVSINRITGSLVVGG
jgi:hypothetical protein